MMASVHLIPANPETVCLLRTIKFLSEVDDCLLHAMARNVRQRSYKSNTALFHAGEPGHILYMVVSGWVRIERVTSSGQTIVIGKRGPGTQLGELALLDGAPRMADAVTDTDCELMTIKRDDFLKCLLESPSASLAVMASLAEMVRNAGASLESYRSVDTLGRLAGILLWYCDRDGSAVPSGGVKINLRLTQQMLADEIGAARESVSRSLRIMEDTGAINREHNMIVVMNHAALRMMAVR